MLNKGLRDKTQFIPKIVFYYTGYLAAEISSGVHEHIIPRLGRKIQSFALNKDFWGQS